MNKTILVASFLLLFATTIISYAVEEHHPATDPKATAQKVAPKATPAAQADMKKMDSSMMEMQMMGKKMQEATSPTEREAIMQQHMQQMKDCMKMMDMMGKDDMMKGAKDGMMAKKMQMMMQMMEQMMMQQEAMMKK